MSNLAKKKKKKGFTLIELVIVLAVLAVISLIAIPNFKNITGKSKRIADETSLEVVKKSMAILAIDEDITLGTYQVTFEGGISVDVVEGSLDEGKVDKSETIETALKDVHKPNTYEGYTITFNTDEVTVEEFEGSEE